MDSVSGKVSKLHHEQSGQLTGFALDCGCEIRFWRTAANCRCVGSLISLGSSLLVKGDTCEDPGGRKYLKAALITDLVSKKSVSVLAPVCLEKPGMLPRRPHTNDASLVPLSFSESAGETKSEAETTGNAYRSGAFVQGAGSENPMSSDDSNHSRSSTRTLSLQAATRQDAGTAVASAYDSLQRIQAILGYLQIVKRHVRGIAQFLEETKHTYEQALFRYQAEDFESAREFAWASADLAQVLEIIISRTLRSDSTYPSIVPPPPHHAAPAAESSEFEEELDQLAALLSRIHWLLDNGTLPLDDRTQVRRITSWSDALFEQARHTRGDSLDDDPAEFVHAARAAASAAEHICRKWYVGNGVVRRPSSCIELREA